MFFFFYFSLNKAFSINPIECSSLSAVYCDLVESLYEKILSYHYATIATVILQDVQSHHWMNHKEFFEVKLGVKDLSLV